MVRSTNVIRQNCEVIDRTPYPWKAKIIFSAKVLPECDLASLFTHAGDKCLTGFQESGFTHLRDCQVIIDSFGKFLPMRRCHAPFLAEPWPDCARPLN